MPTTRPSAIVVGGGIVGTSTARSLHRRGWRVTLLERGPHPNPHGSSGGVHRLIRTTYGSERGYTAMVPPAFEAWERVWQDLGRRLDAHTGMLAVDTAAGTFGADSAATLEALGLPFELLDTDALRARWPQFRIPADATALHTDQAAFLRAGEAVGALGAWLTEQGVQVRQHVQVTAVDPDAGRVVLADGSTLEADRVVVAAGPWTSALVEGLAESLVPSRQVVVDLEPPRDLADAWATGPAFLVQPAYGVPPREGLPLKVGDHGFSLTGDPDDDREPRSEEVDAVLDVAGRALVDLERYRLLEARTCYYTCHEDERFVVRPHGDRGVVCAGFSGHGFKFGPLLGEVVAAALDGDCAWDDVSPWAAGQRDEVPVGARTRAGS